MSRQRRRSLLRENSFNPPEILNPFVHKIEFPWYEKLKIVLMSITIAPIRLLLILIMLAFGWLFASIGVIGATEETWKKPLSKDRKFAIRLVQAFARAAVFFMGIHRIQVRGRRADTSEAMILVAAPHSSFLDLIIGLTGPLPSAISKAENIQIPGVGPLALLAQAILVSREDPNSRQTTLQAITERSKRGGEGMPQTVLFPEGTCTNRTCLINFKAGAFVPGAPVQPVLLRYPNRVDTVTWTMEGPSALQLVWLGLCQFNTKAIVEYLPVYHPNEREQADPKAFASNVRNVMANALNVPVTDHSFDDCRLMNLAKKHKLPMASGILEFSKISRKLKLDFDSIKGLMDHFAEISFGMSGKIPVEDFADYLGLPISPAVERVFSMYDRDGSGTVDFREYVIGLSLITLPTYTEETINLAFNIFDVDKKGYLSVSDFEQVLSSAFAMTHDACRRIFHEIDGDKDGMISYAEFAAFGKQRPEYASLFTVYREFQKELEQPPQEEPDDIGHEKKE